MSYSKSLEAQVVPVTIIDPSTDDETVAADTTVLVFKAKFAGELTGANVATSAAFTGQASGASGNNWLISVLKDNGTINATTMASYQTTTSSDIATAGTALTLSTTTADRRFAVGDEIYVKCDLQNSGAALARPSVDLHIIPVYNHAAE